MIEKYFIVHASEDKTAVAKPLADVMIFSGADVFYDEYSLRLGDSLFESINRGIADSKIGIIVFSPSFLIKAWPNEELRAFHAKRTKGECRIIPIYYDVTPEEVGKAYPLIADNVGINWNKGIDTVATELLDFVGLKYAPRILQTKELSTNHKWPGWTCVLGRFHPIVDPRFEKQVILEYGVVRQSKSRVTLYLENNQFKFRVSDESDSVVEISVNINNWQLHGVSVAAVLDKKNEKMNLYVEGRLERSISFSGVQYSDNMFNKGIVSLGASLEIGLPARFAIKDMVIDNKSYSIEDINSCKEKLEKNEWSGSLMHYTTEVLTIFNVNEIVRLNK